MKTYFDIRLISHYIPWDGHNVTLNVSVLVLIKILRFNDVEGRAGFGI
jgi:hypothetical protein